jgi:acylphosphatase
MRTKFELRAQFFGAVQQVGFRSCVLRIAKTLSITGYVKNLLDGSVELVAIGEKELLEQLLQKLNESMGKKIEREEKKFSHASREYPNFEIRES